MGHHECDHKIAEGWKALKEKLESDPAYQHLLPDAEAFETVMTANGVFPPPPPPPKNP